MDTQKNIIALIAIAAVFIMFWIVGVRNFVPVSVERLGDVVQIQKQKASPDGLLPGESLPTVAVTRHPELGSYLTDGVGRTLYTTTKAECSGECLSVWPPYLTDKAIPENSGRLGTVNNTTADGLQYTWDGQLLYYYAGDQKIGEVNGHEFGGVWFLIQK